MRRITKRHEGLRRITRGRRMSTSWMMRCMSLTRVARLRTLSHCRRSRRMTLRRGRAPLESPVVENMDTRLQGTTTVIINTPTTRQRTTSKEVSIANRRSRVTTLLAQVLITPTTPRWLISPRCLKATTANTTRKSCTMDSTPKVVETMAPTCTVNQAWDDRHVEKGRMLRFRRLRRLGLEGVIDREGRWLERAGDETGVNFVKGQQRLFATRAAGRRSRVCLSTSCIIRIAPFSIRQTRHTLSCRSPVSSCFSSLTTTATSRHSQLATSLHQDICRIALSL